MLSGTEAEAEAAAQSATAAVFYSVSSTQKGLAGVDLGHFLIEKVRKRATVNCCCRCSALPLALRRTCTSRTWTAAGRIAVLPVAGGAQADVGVPEPTAARHSVTLTRVQDLAGDPA